MPSIDEAKKTYLVEARELLGKLESDLLELEENPGDEELVKNAFRTLHTIKGSGAMFGFDEVVGFTHEIENAFDLVRSGKVDVTKDLIDVTLKAGDLISRLLEADADEQSRVKGETDAVVASLKELCSEDVVLAKCRASAIAGESPEPGKPLNKSDVTYRIRFKPSPDIYMMGINPACLILDVEELGQYSVTANTKDIPMLDEIDPEQNYISWDIILTTSVGIEDIRDNFIFVESDSDLTIEVIDEAGGEAEDNEYKRLGEILLEKGELSHDKLKEALSSKEMIGEHLVKEGLIDSSQLESALMEQSVVRGIRKELRSDDVTSSIRVPSEKLDMLMDLVGELVTVQARLSQKTIDWIDFDLIADHTEIVQKLSEDNFKILTEMYNVANDLDRITDLIRISAVKIRMMPIGILFGKFKRLVRDLSVELDREVLLTTEGAETEMDKTVIEQIGSPLMHLIRNSIDHGIETAEKRRSLGKPPQGTIHLNASHCGSNVEISIRDDGGGLNLKAIRAKAVEKGLISQNAKLSEKETFDLILRPGFSTSERVTDVSGRGVGMDVVKKCVDSLRGTVIIKSEKEKGTTITLQLPLTLAIIECLLVQVGGSMYLLPISDISECIELKGEEIESAKGRNRIQVRDTIVPYIRLRDVFGLNGGKVDHEQVIITQVEDSFVGFAVDRVIEKQQTAIKSLGVIYKDLEGISGSTILGDGGVALILDLERLHKKIIREAACS